MEQPAERGLASAPRTVTAYNCPIQGRRYILSRNRPVSTTLHIVAVLYAKWSHTSFTTDEVKSEIRKLLNRETIPAKIDVPMLRHSGLLLGKSVIGKARGMNLETCLSNYSIEYLHRCTEPTGAEEDTLLSRADFESARQKTRV